MKTFQNKLNKIMVDPDCETNYIKARGIIDDATKVSQNVW